MPVTQDAASNVNVGVLQLIRTWKWPIHKLAAQRLAACTFEPTENPPGLKVPWTQAGSHTGGYSNGYCTGAENTFGPKAESQEMIERKLYSLCLAL